MPRGRARAGVLALLAAASTLTFAPVPAVAAPPCGYQTTVLTISDQTAPGGTHTVLVQRPGGPDRASTPVVYLLHGYPGTASDFLHAGVVAAMERAACASGRPVVLAEPDGNDGRLDTEWADDVEGRADLESFLVGPVIAAVEGPARRSRARRTLAGFSMGAFGAAALGLRHPDLFQRIVAVAGYFHLDDPDHVFGNTRSSYRQHDPDVIARPAHQGFFLLDGADDPLPLTAAETPRFAKVLRARRIPVTERVVPGGHDVAILAAQARAVIRYVTR
jgi:predicted esterase